MTPGNGFADYNRSDNGPRHDVKQFWCMTR